MSQEGIYCVKRLTQILGGDSSVYLIPISVLGIVAGYAYDERFVRPLYVGQNVIARDKYCRWYDAKVLEIRPESVLLNYPDLASGHDEVIALRQIDERISIDGPDHGQSNQISVSTSECIVDWMKAELSGAVVHENMPIITITRFLKENATTLKLKMAHVADHCGIEAGEIVDIVRFTHHIMIRIHKKLCHVWIPLFPSTNIPHPNPNPRHQFYYE